MCNINIGSILIIITNHTNIIIIYFNCCNKETVYYLSLCKKLLFLSTSCTVDNSIKTIIFEIIHVCMSFFLSN